MYSVHALWNFDLPSNTASISVPKVCLYFANGQTVKSQGIYTNNKEGSKW